MVHLHTEHVRETPTQFIQPLSSTYPFVDYPPTEGPRTVDLSCASLSNDRYLYGENLNHWVVPFNFQIQLIRQFIAPFPCSLEALRD